MDNDHVCCFTMPNYLLVVSRKAMVNEPVLTQLVEQQLTSPSIITAQMFELNGKEAIHYEEVLGYCRTAIDTKSVRYSYT